MGQSGEPIEIDPDGVSRAMGNVQEALESTRTYLGQVEEVVLGLKQHHDSPNADQIRRDADELRNDMHEIVTQMTAIRDDVFEKGNALLAQAGHEPMSAV